VAWIGDAPDVAPSQLLAAPPDDEERSGRDVARDVILGVLGKAVAGEGEATKEAAWAELKEAAAAEGVLERTARRVRDELKSQGLVDKKKVGSGGWLWHLTEPGQHHLDKLPEEQKDKFETSSTPAGSTSSEPEVGQRPETGQVHSEEPDALTDPFEFEVWLDEEAQSDIPPPRPAEAEPDKAEADDAAGVTHGRS
jgi:hypothetical protein